MAAGALSLSLPLPRRKAGQEAAEGAAYRGYHWMLPQPREV